MSRLWGVLALGPLAFGVVGLVQCGLDSPGMGPPDDSGAPAADGTIGTPDGPGPADTGGGPDVNSGDGGSDAPSCVGVDASADPRNCGVCGHDCLGGGCEAGACQPASVITNEDVVALSIDGTNVYWLNQGNGGVAERCPLTGCVTDGGSAWASAPGPRGLALDTLYAYWTLTGNPGRVERATKSGPLIDTIGPGQYTPTGIVVDDGYVYWVAQGNLARYSKDAGGSPSSLSPTQVGPIALGKGAIFWASSMTIHTCATPDCPTTTDLTLSDQSGVRALAADDTFVYWVRGDSILRCATGGCAQSPTLVGRSTNAATVTMSALTLDATDVYFGTDNGFIGRCSKTGCGVNPTMLAPGTVNVTAIAVDAKAIYWATSGPGGGVHRLVH